MNARAIADELASEVREFVLLPKGPDQAATFEALRDRLHPRANVSRRKGRGYVYRITACGITGVSKDGLGMALNEWRRAARAEGLL